MASTSSRRRAASTPDYVPARRAANDGPVVTPEMIFERAIDFLKRRGLVAITVALMGGLLVGLLAWLNIPLVYTARRDINLHPPDSSQLAEFKQTQIKKLLSPAVCKIAVNLPEARQLDFVRFSADPAEALSRWIEIDTDPLAQSFSVLISDANPEVAQTLDNCVVDAYLQYTQEEKSREISDDIRAAETERDETLRAIQMINDRQIEIARQAGYGDPQSLRKQIDELEAERRDREKERDRADFERLTAEKELEVVLTNTDALTPEQEQSLNSNQQDPAMEKALAVMEAQASEIKRNSVNGELDQDYIRLRQFIERQRSTSGGKDALRERLRESNRKKRDEEVRRLEGRITSLRQQQKTLQKRIDEINQSVGKLQLVAQEIEKSRLDLESKIRSVESANNLLSSLRREARETNSSSPITADLPKLPKSSKKRLMVIFGGGVGAFMAILALFGYADFQVNLITRPEHLERTQPLPVLGVLPRLPEGKRIPVDDDFAQGTKYRSVWLSMNEAINSLRITLTFAPDRHNDGMAALMVTSPRDAEGKSTFVAHLALSLARTGVKVVVVEADIHRPTQYETFGVDREPGLTNVLRGEATVDEVIRETDYPGLYLLPAGSPVDERTPTLLPDRVQSVFSELRSRFQTIIVDAPPVLPVYDAMVFGQHVDETILMVRCDHSRFHTIGQAQNRLESVGIHVAGLVVCGSKTASRYGYYYDSYSGSKPANSNGKPSTNGTTASSKNGVVDYKA